MMSLKIELEGFFAHYDPTKQLVCAVLFKQAIPRNMFESLCRWVQELRKENKKINTILIDFQRLRSFPGEQEMELDNAAIAQFPSLTDMPIVMIVSNSYQRRKLKEYIQSLTNLSGYYIAQSYASAFEFIVSVFPLDGIELPATDMSTCQASLRFDRESGITYITYYGVVTAQTTADVYGHIFKSIGIIGIEAVKAGIWEFRHVNKFDNSNLRSVRHSSSTANKNYDMSAIPTVLVTGDFRQEQMVRLAMKISPQEKRKKIVHSLDEAHQFITDFHAKQNTKKANFSH